MSPLDALKDEFARETRVTRMHLARRPEERFDWKPHVRSFSLGGLGGHLAECVRWAEWIFGSDVLDLDPSAYEALRPRSATELLAVFDASVAGALAAMERSADQPVDRPWQMKVRGSLRVEKTRGAAFRDMSLHHLIHHRGQLTVYLRLLEVPLGGTYGPTADQHG